MATTTHLADYMHRWLTNPNPGTSDATDYVGRDVTSSNRDYMGRPLTFPNPALWVASTAYAHGDHVRLTGGEILRAIVAGTSDAAEPTPPAVGGDVVDGTVTWRRLK